MRRHRAEQVGLVAKHREIRDRLSPIGDRDRQIAQHFATVVAPVTLLGRRHRRRQRPSQPHRVGQIGKQTPPA
ncbi:MAG: hypothetical protein R2710_03645 [Acidimicrobiales bacterium]